MNAVSAVLVAACLGCLSLAAADRLENTYLAPPGAASSGGSGLAPPFQTAPQNSYLPPRQPSPPPQNSYLPPRQSSPPPQNTYVPPGPQSTYITPRPSLPQSSYLPPQTPTPPPTSYVPPRPTQPPQNTYLPPRPVAPQRPAPPAQPTRPTNSYLPPFAGGYSGAGGYGGNAGGFGGNQGQGRPVAIIKQINENNGDGTYTFSYETENGIQAEERGQLRPDGAEGIESVVGSFAYTGPDNVRYSVQYTADENGFLAYGDHLPTPPPIPEAIQRALDANAADEARGIVDDGSYRDDSSGTNAGRPSNRGYQY